MSCWCQTKELRNSGDETARIIIATINEGLVPAANLRRDFEHMLSMVIYSTHYILADDIVSIHVV